MEDPFTNVSVDLSNNISQSTFAEIISVTLKQTKAVSDYPNVASSLPKLAYNLKNLPDNYSKTELSIIVAGNTYNLSGGTPASYVSKAANKELGQLLSSAQFFSKQDIVPVDCKFIDNIVCNTNPDASPCKIDIAFVIDDTGSMGSVINSVVEGLKKTARYFPLVSTDYRMSLVTFKDCKDKEIVSGVPFSTDASGCNNINSIIAALDLIIAKGGNNWPEASDVAMARTIFSADADSTKIVTSLDPIVGRWRTEAIKLVLMVTDAPPGGCDDKLTPDWLGTAPQRMAYMNELATKAASCGYKFLIVSTWDKSLYDDNIYGPGLRETDKIYQLGADITGGIYTYDPPSSSSPSLIPNLLASYIFSLCAKGDNNKPECTPSQNRVNNGLFDAGIQGWSFSFNNIPTTGDPFSYQDSALRIAYNSGGAALAKPDVLASLGGFSIGFDVKGIKGTSITVFIKAGFTNDVYGTYTHTISKDNEYERVRLNFVALDNSFNVNFLIEAEVGQQIETFIDNVYLCPATTFASCSNGSLSLVTNGGFTTGVGGWSNSLGPLSPENDPKYWDSSSFSAILSIDGTTLIKQDINSSIGKVTFPTILTFYLIKNEPFLIKDLAVKYRLYDTNDNTLFAEGTVSNQEIDGFPYAVIRRLEYGPNDGTQYDATLEFTVGTTSDNLTGVTFINSISLCPDSIDCPIGSQRLEYTDFSSGRNGWAGGSYQSTTDGSGNVSASVCITSGDTEVFPDCTANSTKCSELSKTITDLDAGSVVTYLAEYKASATPGGVTNKSLRARVKLQSGDVIISGLHNDIPPITIQSDRTLRITITIDPGNVTDPTNALCVDSILLCIVPPVLCKGSVTDFRAAIEWNTIPKRPINVFAAFVKYEIRDYSDPSIVSYQYVLLDEGRLSTPSPTNCDDGVVCDFWKQQGVANTPQTQIFKGNINTITNNDVNKLSLVSPGKIVDLSNAPGGPIQNYLWSVPASKTSNQHDQLVLLPSPLASGNVDRYISTIELYYLANQIQPNNGEVPYSCGPVEDYECFSEKDGFDVVISYTNTLGIKKEYRQSFDRNSLITQRENFDQPPNGWDSISSTGFGKRGAAARWQVASFDIDNILGTGLDQCSEPIPQPLVTGNGAITFNKLMVKGTGLFYDPCDAEIDIQLVNNGEVINEKQSITLPNPTGGTWSLTVRVFGEEETLTLSATVNAVQLQAAIEGLANVGSGNVLVTGNGSASTPFIVEFVGDLAGLDIALMRADGTNLVGASPGIVNTIFNGNKNEIQQINQAKDNMMSMIASFNGSSTLPLPYNVSIDGKQKTLEALSSIGVGNISVTGETTDRTVEYTGPLYIEFIGKLANTNVPQMTVSPNPNYSVFTVVEGGVGVNEKQSVTVTAKGGSFKLTVINPNDEQSFTTNSISYNATAAEVKAALVESPFFELADIKVEKTLSTETHQWTVEFTGTFAGLDIDQMTINTSELLGGDIFVQSISNGNTSTESQRIKIIRADGGFFNLVITVNGVTETTTNIIWNTTAQGLQQIIAAHSLIEPFNVVVIQETPSDPEIVAQFLVTFRRLINVETMQALFQESLLCNPIVFDPVPEPPYDYPLPCIPVGNQCGAKDCLPGPLPSKACEGESPLPVEPCCTIIRESANKASLYSYQRDLVASPSSKTITIRQLARSKSLDTSKYKPYLRNFSTNQLTEANYDSHVVNGMSVVLVDRQIDSVGGRYQISKHLTNSREILPSRMIWPTGAPPLIN